MKNKNVYFLLIIILFIISCANYSPSEIALPNDAGVVLIEMVTYYPGSGNIKTVDVVSGQTIKYYEQTIYPKTLVYYPSSNYQRILIDQGSLIITVGPNTIKAREVNFFDISQKPQIIYFAAEQEPITVDINGSEKLARYGIVLDENGKVVSAGSTN